MCKIFIMCTELFVRGSVRHEPGEWSLPNASRGLAWSSSPDSDQRHHYAFAQQLHQRERERDASPAPVPPLPSSDKTPDDKFQAPKKQEMQRRIQQKNSSTFIKFFDQ